MKKLKILLMLIIAVVTFATITPAQDSSSPPNSAISVSENDLKEFQKVLADREFFKAKSDTLEKQSAEWRASAENWRRLYEDAKNRADVVQEKRIASLESALTRANDAINGQRDIINSYKDETGRLRAENQRVRKRELKMIATSFGVGVGAGGLAGWRIGSAIRF
jgi:ABC-type Fe3+-hydroxamate transport system substrate-binding protein